METLTGSKVMSMKDKIFRTVRANLNDIVDRVNSFEEQGGFRRIVDPLAEELGWEEIGSSTVHRPKSEKTIRDYYANLEVPYGSDLETVKESYRRLMRKYHPDKHAHDKEAEALATELTQELTKAYQAIESYLQTGRY